MARLPARTPLGLALVVTLALVRPAAADPPPPPADLARGLEDPNPVQPVDGALLLPRVVLGITRFAFDVLSLPLLGAVHLEERYHVASWLEDLFYNDARTAAIMPTFSFATFTGSEVGIVAFHNDLFGNRERLRLSTRFAGSDDHAEELSFSAGTKNVVGWLVRYERAPDLDFHGIDTEGPESQFEQERFLGVLRGGHRFGPVYLGATGLFNHREFDGGTITERYDTAMLEGYGDGVDNLELQANLSFDSRPLRAEAFFGGVPAGSRYIHYGAEAAVTIGLWRPDRRIVLRGAFETVDGSEIPFTDYPRLGGPGRLRGYPVDRFRGSTAVIGTAEYRYPVHQFVDGALFIDAGHVTGNDWHAGGGLGLVVHSRERVLFSFDLAYGDGLTVVVSTDPLRAFARKDTEL